MKDNYSRPAYVIIKDNDLKCYSNLSKLVRNTANVTYFPIYTAFRKSNRIEYNGYVIYKTILK